jgi:hypothetical protein
MIRLKRPSGECSVELNGLDWIVTEIIGGRRGDGRVGTRDESEGLEEMRSPCIVSVCASNVMSCGGVWLRSGLC